MRCQDEGSGKGMEYRRDWSDRTYANHSLAYMNYMNYKVCSYPSERRRTGETVKHLIGEMQSEGTFSKHGRKRKY